MKTSELTGSALNWAVAKCNGVINEDKLDIGFIKERGYTPSTDWAEGGAIIEREGISICNLEANVWGVEGWTASVGELWSPDEAGWVSPTPLIAAMRCYVASKLGDEVEIPDELLNHA